jgi:hypothetical protein
MSAADSRPRPVLLERVTDSIEAFSLVHFLSAQGFPVHLTERPLKLALGEIPFLEAASELYLDDPSRLEEARALIGRYRSGYLGVRGTAWTCAGCGEHHEPQFGACWRCGAVRGGTPRPAVKPARSERSPFGTKPARGAKRTRGAKPSR